MLNVSSALCVFRGYVICYLPLGGEASKCVFIRTTPFYAKASSNHKGVVISSKHIDYRIYIYV